MIGLEDIYAIRFGNRPALEHRYMFYSSKEQRDAAYILITSRQDPEVIKHVEKVVAHILLEEEA